MSKISTNSKYKGDVTLRLKLKDKVITIKKHNNGLLTLSKAFALYMCNNQNKDAYVPNFIDLQYIKNPESITDIENLEHWKSYLTTELPISGLYYTLSDSAYKESGSDVYQKNWVTVANARIPFSVMMGEVSYNSTSIFRLFLLTDIIADDSSTDRRLCYVDVSAQELSRMEPGTELQIEWVIQLVHAPVQSN